MTRPPAIALGSTLLLALLLLAAALGLAPAAGALEVSLAPREPLTSGAVRSLLEAALPAQPPGRRLELRITEPRLPLANPSEAPVVVAVEEPRLDPSGERVEAELVVRVAGQVTGVLKLRGEARTLVEVPAPLQPLPGGQAIEPGLLGTIWLPERTLRPDIVLAAQEVVGLETDRPLGAGRPIRQADLRAPRLVRKGEVVTLLYRRGGVEITAQARALEDGAEGERVRAVNLDSERPVAGLVIGRKRVLVGAAEGRP